MRKVIAGAAASLFGKPFPGMYSDEYIFALLPKHSKQIWLLTAPKSGSTWLSVILENYLGWNTQSLSPAFERREQEPCLRSLARESGSDRILWRHSHTRASESTTGLIRRVGIHPIIQTRNLPDALVSFYDHCTNESPVTPMAYMDPRRWAALSDSSRMDFVVDLVAPWYFNFYAGWFSDPLVRDRTAHLCAYEDLVADPAGEVVGICEHFGLEVDRPSIDAAVKRSERQPTRLNLGVIGRGSALSDAQHARLAAMRGFYPDIDFSSIGFAD